ncbi:hypothetical protein BDZ91DRAFT_801571 [Kalaharituber pfeilii]|nr:hypothetical protein BDZ91DRAFT_801571 [Kalaharituber pfeilii]
MVGINRYRYLLKEYRASADTQSEWGVGQTAAILTWLPLIVEGVIKIWQFHKTSTIATSNRSHGVFQDPLILQTSPVTLQSAGPPNPSEEVAQSDPIRSEHSESHAAGAAAQYSLPPRNLRSGESSDEDNIIGREELATLENRQDAAAEPSAESTSENTNVVSSGCGKEARMAQGPQVGIRKRPTLAIEEADKGAKIGTFLQYQDEMLTEAGRKGKGKLPSQDEAFKRHLAVTSRKGPSPRPRSTSTSPPTNPDATTRLKTGIVVHGIALRKDLGKVRQWLEAANKELGKISGIRWLRKKTTLVEEGKKTSSAVVYLEKETEAGRVRLGRRWLRWDRYESERGRK